MKCPNCKKELKIHCEAEYTMEKCMEKIIVVTECCGTLVEVIPYFSYFCKKHEGRRKIDDWGNKPK